MLGAVRPPGDFTAPGDEAQVSRIKGEVEQAKESLARKRQYLEKERKILEEANGKPQR